LMFYRAAHALHKADPTLDPPEPLRRALDEARQLSTYGGDLWDAWRVIECETVGMFPELSIESIAPYLHDGKRELREAAEAAYKARGISPSERKPIYWPEVWIAIDGAASKMATPGAVAELLTNPAAVDLSAPAAWHWENPAASAASPLCAIVEKKLKAMRPIEGGEYLPPEYEWLLRALARHATLTQSTGEFVARLLTSDQKEVAGAVVQEVEKLPFGFAPELLRIAKEDSGWQRYKIASWALANADEPEVAAALKAANVSVKMLKGWMG
jgi:hypothetical protein